MRLVCRPNASNCAYKAPSGQPSRASLPISEIRSRIGGAKIDHAPLISSGCCAPSCDASCFSASFSTERISLSEDPCHRKRSRVPGGMTISDPGWVCSIAFFPLCHHSKSRSPAICRWRHRLGCSCSGISPGRTICRSKDVFPRLFPDRDLIMRSGNQGHQMRATDYGNASQWTLGIPPFHRSPECVFRNICIAAQLPN